MKTTVAAICLSLCACGGESGPDVAGTYTISGWKTNQSAGQFPCDEALVDLVDPDPIMVITDGDFGIKAETCEAGPSNCFPLIGLILNESRADGYDGKYATTSLSGNVCTMYHITNSLDVRSDGGLTLSMVRRYQSGDPNNCTLEEAEKVAGSNTCTEIDEITTGPPQ